MKKVVCPYCFEEFKRSEVKFRCKNSTNKCPDVEDKEMYKFWGEVYVDKKVITPQLNFVASSLNMMPKSAKCDTCNTVTTITICPHCHNELPREMVENGGMIISIIGARSSGKTNYITTLINELDTMGEMVNLGIYPSSVGRNPNNKTANRYKNDFFDLLYNGKKCHSQTDVNDPRSKVPLIYKLFSTTSKDAAYLVIYDTAGENFSEVRAIEEKAKFLRNSDGVILLLDTFCIPNVHERLKQKFNLPSIELNYDAIITNLVDFFDGQVSKKEFYTKPLALTFSKIDAIVVNDELFSDARLPNISMNYNSQYLDGDGYHLDEVDSIDQGLQAGLRSWGEGGFISKINAPVHFNGQAKFFGISALGDMPSGTDIKYIKPYRVLDPLLWILYRLKFALPVKK